MAAPRAIGVIALLFVLPGLTACAGRASRPLGGPTAAATVELTPQPSFHPTGPGVRTGVVVGRTELVIFFASAGDGDGSPAPYQTWLDTDTSAFAAWPTLPDGEPVTQLPGTWAAVGDSAFLDLRQLAFVGYPLVEWGAIRARPARVVIEAGGATFEATFTPWPADPEITIFWLQRWGQPNPTDTPAGAGRWSPLPPENYPLVTAFDADGRVIDSIRLRDPGYEEKGG